MGSFDIAYDADEDVLEVSFDDGTDGEEWQTIALNDHIVIQTDEPITRLWGVTFHSFVKLLGVSETEFTALKEYDEDTVNAILRALSQPPASFFFDLTDPEALIARISGPSVESLVATDQEL